MERPYKDRENPFSRCGSPTFGQEISGWSEQLKDAENAIIMSLNDLYFLPLGELRLVRINCPKGFCEESIKSISDDTNLMFYKSKIIFLLWPRMIV